MFRLKKAIVIAMEWTCSRLDKIPTPYRYQGKWEWGGGYFGCYLLSLARRSAMLDERWHTGVWTTPEDNQPR